MGPGQLTDRLLAGDRTVLGRAVSIAENGGERWARLSALLPPRGAVPVIGFTGGAGSGKSTLIDAMIGRLRRCRLRIGVAAIDPSSPFTGGAVLGDRCRMNRHQNDPGVYIRSLSARGSVGGLSAGAARVIDTLKRSAFDLILIETVGAGQSEVDIVELADICVVICTPNSGDDVQAIKSGILEIADILVVNKTDLAEAGRTVRQLKLAQSLRSNAPRRVPVLETIATDGSGIETLIDAILERAGDAGDGARRERGADLVKRRVAHAVAMELEQRLLDAEDDVLDPLCQRVICGELGVEDAAHIWLDKKL